MCKEIKNVEFNAAWKNGTGYFDGAMNGPDAPTLEAGEVISFMDDYDRPGFIIGLPKSLGNLVVFQRYSGRSDRWTMNVHPRVESLLGSKYSQHFDTLSANELVGLYEGCIIGENIGEKLQAIMSL